MDDIRALSGIGVSAAIVGMALYTGKLTAAQVEEALDQ
jgi:phosphoribosylformimino-5-aminoimidazole carboxamide ribonucleotide (ProFAR) isomerase